jgi:hypothetical protein
VASEVTGAAAEERLVSDGFYSDAELVALGSPLRLEPDFAICDLAGCDGTGYWLIPGASVCRECGERIGLGGPPGSRYHIDTDLLTGDSRWRAARRAEYVERVGTLTPQARNAFDDELLTERVRRRVELLLMFDLVSE